jgi:hypothetical protein
LFRLMTLRFCSSGASAAAPEVAQLEVVPSLVVAQPEAVPSIVAERSFEGEPLQPVAAAITPEDIVTRATNIAVVAPPMLAVSIVAVQSQAVLFVAVPTQEVAQLPAAEARMSPTAVADAVGNK